MLRDPTPCRSLPMTLPHARASPRQTNKSSGFYSEWLKFSTWCPLLRMCMSDCAAKIVPGRRCRGTHALPGNTHRGGRKQELPRDSIMPHLAESSTAAPPAM